MQACHTFFFLKKAEKADIYQLKKASKKLMKLIWQNQRSSYKNSCIMFISLQVLGYSRKSFAFDVDSTIADWTFQRWFLFISFAIASLHRFINIIYQVLSCRIEAITKTIISYLHWFTNMLTNAFHINWKKVTVS